jgi:hypothetical protein
MEIIHPKYYKLRKKILGISILILFILFVDLKFFLPDYLVKESDLKIDSGIIKYSFYNKYITRRSNHLGYMYVNCLDVVLVDKPYVVRFTSATDDKYWEIIMDSRNYSKPIQVKYQERLLHNNILWNPNEVLIDNKIIIPSDSKKSLIGLIFLFFIAGAIVCGNYLFSLWKQYKEELYSEDLIVSQESKWKLFMVWLDE